MLRKPWMRALVVFPALAALASAGTAQQSPGVLVDAGGYKVFTSSHGSGDPTVVFVSGLGEDLSTWDKVAPKVAGFARTFAYDRAGLGKSDQARAQKTLEQMVRELHAALTAASVKPPMILVGHSLGGAIVEIYAHSYRGEIAGLVLVDPEDSRLLDRLQNQLPKADWDARQQLLDKMMAGASPAQKAEIEASKESGPLVEASLPLPSVPTVLLTGTLKDPEFPGNPLEQDIKMELHKDLLAQTPKAKQVLAPNSRHYIQDDAPDLVIAAIREVVDQVRGGAGKKRSRLMTKE